MTEREVTSPTHFGPILDKLQRDEIILISLFARDLYLLLEACIVGDELATPEALKDSMAKVTAYLPFLMQYFGFDAQEILERADKIDAENIATYKREDWKSPVS